jgi:hypothetical protein
MEFSDIISVKNSSLISSVSQDEETGTLTVTIKPTLEDGSPVKLGHVLNELPAGIIDKGVTGFGGTTLELDCDRPSIVVEPYNYTAGSKSKSPSISNQYEIFWYGSIHAMNEVLGFNPAHSNGPNLLLELYIERCKDKQQPPKILVIPDQLQSLKDHVNKLDDYNWTDFHLLFDEIDSMQEQISFRNKMHKVTQLHLEHPIEKRTFLSATLSKFHDPQLKEEQYFKFNYEDAEKVNVDLIASTGVAKRTAVTIIERLESNKEDKILVAYNHIKGILNTIEFLLKGNNSLKKHIAVLCGTENKKEFEGYTHDINQDTFTLPKQINFITAAYFNGHDILEKAHLISCIDANITSLRLSPRTLYQIQGRCRPGTLSQTWIGRFSKPHEKQYKIDVLEDYAALTINVLDATDKIKAHHDPQISKAGTTMENIFYNGLDDVPSVLALGKDNQREISYFKIDSLIEDGITRDYLKHPNTFIRMSKTFFTATLAATHEEDKDQKKKDPIEIALKANNHFALEDIIKGNIANKEIAAAKKFYNTTTGKQVIEIYQKIQGKEIFLHKQVRKQLDVILKSDKAKATFKKFYRHVHYHAVFTNDYNDTKHTLLPKTFKQFNVVNKKGLQSFYNNYSTMLEQALPTLNKADKKAVTYLITRPSAMKDVLLTLNTTYKKKVAHYTVKTFDVFSVLNLPITTELNLNLKKTVERKVFLSENNPIQKKVLYWVKTNMNEKEYRKGLKDGFHPELPTQIAKEIIEGILLN